MTRLAVSDHALVRFLERGAGLQVETLRAELAASLERARAVAADIDAHDFNVIVGGLRFIVMNGVLVTVVEVNKVASRPTASLNEGDVSSRPTASLNEGGVSSRPTASLNEGGVSSRPTASLNEGEA
jgi:hypothetical protein